MHKAGEKKMASKNLLVLLARLLVSAFLLPFRIMKGLFLLARKTNETVSSAKTSSKRSGMMAIYSQFELLKAISGDFDSWEKKILEAESKIGIILGARGTGKSALGIKLLENFHSKSGKKCYAMGFVKEDMPSWIDVVEDIEEIKNSAAVLIDEGGILFSSRKSMTNANKILGDLILIARHKSLSIIFISQNSSNLDVNILRQADYLMLKPSSLLQMDFERKKIRELYKEVEGDFESNKDKKGLTYIYSDDFRGFVANPLPSFWSINLSKAFK